LLSRHNLGLDSVKDAYNLAWHAHALANRIELEADLRKASLEFVNSFYIEGLVFGFTIKYAVTNVNFFKELLAVRPTVHFGHCGFAHQTKGALTEKLTDLTNPNMFAEFKLKSNWLSQGIEAAEAHFQLCTNQEAESSFFHEPEVEPMRYLLTEYGVPSHHFPELLRYAVEMTSSYSTFNAHVQHDRKRLDELATSGEPSGDEELRINRFSAERSLQNSISNAETFKQESITEWMNNTAMTDGRFFDRLFSIVITSSIPRLPSFADLSTDLERLVGPGTVPIKKIEIPIQQLLNAPP
jgi:hypothetical protein